MANVSSSNGLEKRPKLRFPGFDEPWCEVKIKDIFRVTRGSVLAADMVSSSNTAEYEFPVYSSQTKSDGLLGYFDSYLYENAITWTTDGANAGTVHYRDGKFYCTNVCGVLLNEDGYANRCTAAILGSVSKKYVSYVGNPKLMNNIMSEIPIVIPSLKEQYKIDSLIAVLDKRIKAQQMIISHLKKYKRGVVRSLLSPEDCKLKNAQWTRDTIGNLGSFIKGAPLSKADISKTGTPFILYGELYTTYHEVITSVVRKTESEVDSVYRSIVGDVLIPTSGETPEEISTASCVMLPGVILAGDLNIFRSSKVDGRIMSYILNHIVNGSIARVAQGKSIVHVQASEISKIEISYPDPETQNRIIKLLEAISSRVELCEKELENLSKLRSSLLQQLFI